MSRVNTIVVLSRVGDRWREISKLIQTGKTGIPAVNQGLIYALAGYPKKIIFVVMRPDYDHKLFNDKRMGYCLLMEALAMDSL